MPGCCRPARAEMAIKRHLSVFSCHFRMGPG